jgi:putative PEP-CTERM system TPR-repeat lipoprotein
MRVPALWLGIAASVLLAPLAAADEKDAEAYRVAGIRLLDQGHVGEAIVQLQNAVENDPQNASGHYYLGVARLKIGELWSAELELHAARALHFDDDKVVTALLDLFLLGERYQQLLNEIPAGNRPAELEGRVRLSRGTAYYALKRVTEAEQSFKEALALASQPGPALVGLARLKAESGNLLAARTMVEQALAADPKAPEAWVLSGRLHLVGGQRDNARQDFDRAVELSPRYVPARLARASGLIDDNDFVRAEADLAAVFAASPKNLIGRYLQALILARKGDYIAAEQALLELGDLIGAYPPALFLFSKINIARNRLDVAEENLRRYLEEQSDDSAGIATLASILLKRGKTAQAIELLEPAVVRDPSDIQLLALLSDAYSTTNQVAKANGLLDRISTLAPRDASVHSELATRRMRIGRLDVAILDLQRAAELSPDSSNVGVLLVLSYLKANRLDEALGAAERLKAEYPEDPAPEDLLGMVLRRREGPAAARPHFEAALAMRPAFTSAALHLAEVDVAEKRMTDAAGLYAEVLKREPANGQALEGTAELSLAEGRTADAIAALEKVRAADAVAIGPRLRLVDLYLAGISPVKAMAVARELETIAPQDSRVLEALARTHFANKLDSAAVYLRRLADLNPRSPIPLLNLARVLHSTNDDVNALEALRRAMSVRRDDPQVQQELISFAIKADLVDPAIKIIDELLAKDRGDSSLETLAYGLLSAAGRDNEAAVRYARALASREAIPMPDGTAPPRPRLDTPDEIVAVFRGWLSRHREDTKSRLVLGDYLLNMKKYDEATVAFEQVRAAEPNNVIVLNNLAWLYQVKGDGRAIQVASEAYRLAPGIPEIADTYGWALVVFGDNERGLAVLRHLADAPSATPASRYHLAVALKNAGRPAEARRELEKVLASQTPFGDRDKAQQLMAELNGG